MDPDRVEPFTPDSLLWDLTGDVRTLLALPAAFVLQVAHPAVGAGVDEHSVFRTDPWGRATRSLRSLQLWVYGGELALAEGSRLRTLHRAITGTDTRGRPYRALDPEPYAWVHATAYPVVLRSCAYLSRPLGERDARRLYEEHRHLGRILGIPERDMPPTPEAYWAYFASMLHKELELTVVVRELTDPTRQLPPPPGASRPVRLLWPLLWPPLARLRVLFTVGLLPPPAREVLGLRWTAADERRLRRYGALLRLVVPRLPERVRWLPVAREARRKVREGLAVRFRRLRAAFGTRLLQVVVTPAVRVAEQEEQAQPPPVVPLRLQRPGVGLRGGLGGVRSDVPTRLRVATYVSGDPLGDAHGHLPAVPPHPDPASVSRHVPAPDRRQPSSKANSCPSSCATTAVPSAFSTTSVPSNPRQAPTSSGRATCETAGTGSYWRGLHPGRTASATTTRLAAVRTRHRMPAPHRRLVRAARLPSSRAAGAGRTPGRRREAAPSVRGVREPRGRCRRPGGIALAAMSPYAHLVLAMGSAGSGGSGSRGGYRGGGYRGGSTSGSGGGGFTTGEVLLFLGVLVVVVAAVVWMRRADD